jgi:hypothetical protein
VPMADAVARSGASRRTLQRAIEAGDIPRRKSGRVAYVDVAALDAWTAAREAGNRATDASHATHATRTGGTGGEDVGPTTRATNASHATSATRANGTDGAGLADQLAAAVDRATRAEHEADRWAKEAERLSAMLADALTVARREQERADQLAAYLSGLQGGIQGQLPVPLAAILDADISPAGRSPEDAAAAVDLGGLDVASPEHDAATVIESAGNAPDAPVTHFEAPTSDGPPSRDESDLKPASPSRWDQVRQTVAGWFRD